MPVPYVASHLDLNAAPRVLPTIQIWDGFAPDLITHLPAANFCEIDIVLVHRMPSSQRRQVTCSLLDCRRSAHHRLPAALDALRDIESIAVHDAIVGRYGLRHPTNPDLCMQWHPIYSQGAHGKA